MSKYLSIKYLLISKTVTLAKPFKKIDCCAVNVGISEEGGTFQTMSKYLSVKNLLMSKN